MYYPEYVNRPLTLESGYEIEQLKYFKYLGVELDSTLSIKAHYDSVIKRVLINISNLYEIFYWQSNDDYGKLSCTLVN